MSWHKFATFLPQRWNVVLRTLFAHSSSIRDKIVFENYVIQGKKATFFESLLRMVQFFLTCLFSPHKTSQKKNHTIWTGKTKLVSLSPFLSFSSSLLVKKTNKQKPRKGRHTCSERMSSFSNANLLISGTTLRPSWQVQVFTLCLHLFQLVTATNEGKKQMELRQTWSNNNQMKVQDKKTCSTWRW